MTITTIIIIFIIIFTTIVAGIVIIMLIVVVVVVVIIIIVQIYNRCFTDTSGVIGINRLFINCDLVVGVWMESWL